eukprot:1159253-Pelagomonas_calceolata.AAC.5
MSLSQALKASLLTDLLQDGLLWDTGFISPVFWELASSFCGTYGLLWDACFAVRLVAGPYLCFGDQLQMTQLVLNCALCASLRLLWNTCFP